MSFRVSQIESQGARALSTYFSMLLSVGRLLGAGVTLGKVIMGTEGSSSKGSCELSRAESSKSWGLSESDLKKGAGRNITVFTIPVAAESQSTKYAASLDQNWF